MSSSPSTPGRTTNSASPEKICSSALTTSTWIVWAMNVPQLPYQPSRASSLQRLRFLECLLDRADHVEGLLGQLVALAVDDHLEALDRVLQRHVLARRAGEYLRDGERLRQEALDLACAGDRELVLGRELVHAQDRDDVAKLLVLLQHRLHAARRVVV